MITLLDLSHNASRESYMWLQWCSHAQHRIRLTYSLAEDTIPVTRTNVILIGASQSAVTMADATAGQPTYS